jgi:hypothetical protein
MRRFFAPVLPADGVVLEAEVRHEPAASVHDDDVVVVASPVKAGEVGAAGGVCREAAAVPARGRAVTGAS